MSSGTVTTISSVRNITTSEECTYNITVENAHTYYVGKMEVLVHNEGEEINGKIYVGFTSEEEPIYVGQTKQPIKSRQAQHLAEGKNDPDKAWKTDMTIQKYPGMDGLTEDQMDYHERRIYDELTAQGHNLKNSQIPLTDPKVNKLKEKYC